MDPQISKARRRQLTNDKIKVKMQYATDTMEDDVESVEYLEECHVVDDKCVDRASTVEDTFYPNAIHCLISMYQDRYEQLLKDKNAKQIRGLGTRIWQDISKDMRDCFFDFNALQVQQKFTQLRQQYFNVSTKKSAEDFEFFQPLHAMYQDKSIAGILTGGADVKPLHTYRDDVLFSVGNEDSATYEDGDKMAQSSNKNVTKRLEDVTHKENEELDLVERELQAMEQECEVKTCTVPQSLSNAVFIKHERPIDLTDNSIVAPKRIRQSVSTTDENTEPVPEKEAPPITKNADLNLTNGADMSLAAYNAAQQQRHDEKMALLRQSLLLQEHSIDVQRQLLEQLIKRL